MTLEASLTEAINAHLPSQVGAALQARLKKADQEAAALALAAEKIQRLERLEALEAALRKKEGDLQQRENQCVARENALKEQELVVKHKDEMASLRNSNAQERVGEMKELVHAVFRSPVFKSNFTRHESGTTPVSMPSGGYVNTAGHSKTETVEHKVSQE